MLASRKRLSPSVVALALVLVVLFYHSSHVDHIYQTWSLSFDSYSLRSPANRTLGFGAVVVVSSKDSERRHTLVQAANVTDFDVVVPDQPKWTEGDLQRFIDGQEDAQRGSILAWLGHHNALRWFLNSGLETALILEDDVDWDIRLRSIQIPLAAGAARQILSPQRSRYSFSKVRQDASNYWGDHNAWDLLYLGHCGDYFEEVNEDGPSLRSSYNLTSMPHIVYRDPTVPLPSNLHPFTQTLFGALNMPPHARALHRSKFPLCSFGYAVNRQTAKQLLRDLAPPRLKPRGPRAFDVALLHACRQGAKLPSIPLSQTPLSHNTPSSGLRCWTLNSELFHHMPGRSLVDGIGQEMGEQPGIPPVDLAGTAQVFERNETSNIDCGFWSGAFAFEENDIEHLRFLQERVGRHGTCLKEGRYAPGPKIRI